MLSIRKSVLPFLGQGSFSSFPLPCPPFLSLPCIDAPLPDSVILGLLSTPLTLKRWSGGTPQTISNFYIVVGEFKMGMFKFVWQGPLLSFPFPDLPSPFARRSPDHVASPPLHDIEVVVPGSFRGNCLNFYNAVDGFYCISDDIKR